jgi:Trk K+ transport system NAD-binding subunit
VLGIDFDPRMLARAEARGVTVMYGDAEDADLVKRLPLDCAEWALSSSPDRTTNLVLLRALREAGYDGRVALTAHFESAARQLEAGGADLVLRPFVDAADDAVRALGYSPREHPEPAAASVESRTS